MYRAMDLAFEYLNRMGHKVIAYGFPYDRNNYNSRFMAWKNYIKKITGNTGWEKYLLAMNQNEMKDDPRILKFPKIYRNKVSIQKKISSEKENLHHRSSWKESWMRQQLSVSTMNSR